MPPKKRSKTDASSAGPPASTINTGELLKTGVSKSGLKQILDSLHTTGHLNVTLSANAIKRKVAHHSKVDTPHGKVIQSMQVGGKRLEYIHPAALLFYLCTISDAFRSAMHSAKAEATDGRCQIVIYSDAATPGNVFRPDKGRKYEAFYWCLGHRFIKLPRVVVCVESRFWCRRLLLRFRRLDIQEVCDIAPWLSRVAGVNYILACVHVCRCVPEWPDHILTRSLCWATLCLVRSVIVDTIAGGLSLIFTHLLQLFDVLIGGILLPGDDEPFMFSGTFAGVLADLVGHQSLTAWKGPNAVRGCVNCANLSCRRNGVRTDSEIGLAEHDERRFLQSTDEEIYLLIDNLATLVEAGAPKIDKLQTEIGFNHEPLGILSNKGLRAKYSPTKHQLTDWMHTFCQDGVASAEVVLLLERLSTQHQPPITNPMVQTFLEECVLPTEHGKTDGKWVEPKRLRGNSLKAFSSMVLSIVPCIALLLRVYNVAAQLPEEVECFLMLDAIFGILTLGPRRSMQFIDRLHDLVIAHHRLFARLYADHVKPKLHHTHHVVSSMRWLGFSLNCFVTERKHKFVNQLALHTFRYFEHTSLMDCLHQQCEYLSTGHDLFASEFLVHPKAVQQHAGLATSSVALCHVGQVHSKDVFCTKGGVVAKAESFWQHSTGSVYVRASSFPSVDTDFSVRDTRSSTVVLVEASEILDICIWCYIRPNIMMVRLPPALLL